MDKLDRVIRRERAASHHIVLQGGYALVRPASYSGPKGHGSHDEGIEPHRFGGDAKVLTQVY